MGKLSWYRKKCSHPDRRDVSMDLYIKNDRFNGNFLFLFMQEHKVSSCR